VPFFISAMNRPKHRAAARYKHVVKGAHTFREVEARIEQEEFSGTAFEVFHEAYMAVIRRADYKDFWSWGSVPIPVLRALGLPDEDKGIDAIGANQLGDYDSTQCKFKTGRPTLVWGDDEIGRFFGLSDSGAWRKSMGGYGIGTKLLGRACSQRFVKP
jgi:predicted helicase